MIVLELMILMLVFLELKSAEELGFVDRQKLEVFDGTKFRTATIVETKNHLLVKFEIISLVEK